MADAAREAAAAPISTVRKYLAPILCRQTKDAITRRYLKQLPHRGVAVETDADAKRALKRMDTLKRAALADAVAEIANRISTRTRWPSDHPLLSGLDSCLALIIQDMNREEQPTRSAVTARDDTAAGPEAFSPDWWQQIARLDPDLDPDLRFP